MTNEHGRLSPGPRVRIMPVSSKAATQGFEEVFADEEAFEKTVERFKRLKTIYDYIHSLRLLHLSAAVIPEGEPSERLTRADLPVIIGGAAIYVACLKKEARVRHVAFPKVTKNDCTHAMAKLMPGEAVDMPHGNEEYVGAISQNILSKSMERARDFAIVETNFCTEATQYFTPERGYATDFWHDTLLGASQVYHLLDTKYERGAVRTLIV